MAHGGANRYKKAAFAAVKDVIERGALVLEKSDGREASFYFSAPVEIDGRNNIETVLVHRDPNTHRMYLHSVTTKENLLNQRVSSADAEASERSGSTNSGGITTVLQNLLNFNADGVSKVVDSKGRPLVMYNWTNKDFNSFELPDSGAIWFSSDPTNTAPSQKFVPGGRTVPVFLSLQNPAMLSFEEIQLLTKDDVERLKNEGHDGVVCGRGRNPTLRLWPTIFSGKIDVFPGDRRSRLISSMTSVAPA